jgi:hypothetical protein
MEIDNVKISLLNIKAGDVLVVSCPGVLTSKDAQRLQDDCHAAVLAASGIDTKVIIMHGGLKLEVLREAKE